MLSCGHDKRVPLKKYLDDIAHGVGVLLSKDIPVDIDYIMRSIKYRLVAEALLKNCYIKLRAAEFLNMRRTCLLNLMEKPEFAILNKLCKQHNAYCRRRERGKYNKRR
jgi:hypothetical protein